MVLRIFSQGITSIAKEAVLSLDDWRLQWKGMERVNCSLVCTLPIATVSSSRAGGDPTKTTSSQKRRRLVDPMDGPESWAWKENLASRVAGLSTALPMPLADLVMFAHGWGKRLGEDNNEEDGADEGKSDDPDDDGWDDGWDKG